jgi:hypothetical protein
MVQPERRDASKAGRGERHGGEKQWHEKHEFGHLAACVAMGRFPSLTLLDSRRSNRAEYTQSFLHTLGVHRLVTNGDSQSTPPPLHFLVGDRRSKNRGKSCAPSL